MGIATPAPKTHPQSAGVLPEHGELWVQVPAVTCRDPCWVAGAGLLCCCEAEEGETQGG